MNLQPLLLDTCALIWIAEGEPLSPAAVELIERASGAGVPTYVSPISAWEIGMLASRRRITISITPESWFYRALDRLQMQLAEMSPDILIESSFLPGDAPRDPADRILAATARHYGCTLITRDRTLLDYGEQGHARVVNC